MELNMMMKCRLLMTVLCFAGVSQVHAETVQSPDGWSLTVDPASGDFSIATKSPSWTVGGSITKQLTHVAADQGSDNIGPFHRIAFAWQDNGRRSGSICVYDEKPIATFSVKYEDAVNGSPTPFPVLSKLPENLMAFRYGETDHLRPELFHLQGSEPNEQYGGPFALFDEQANAMIVSPASNFMIAQMSGDLQTGIASGLNRTLVGVPAGYEQKTLLAIGPGVNKTWDAWGHGLTSLYNKKRPANDSETGLKYLGYWTDNGSYYYYNYDFEKGYAGTLLAVKDYLARQQVPIHYMQLDSWWYPKTFASFQKKEANKPRSKDPRLPAGLWNRYGGMLEFVGDKDLFPGGLGAFQKMLGMPLVVHSRWVDPESPYRKDYKISGVAPVDPKWWGKITADIASWGVTTYEQDWNNWIYLKSRELSDTTWAGDAYLDGMANSCAANGLTMQYCMVIPRMLMQGGAKYANLTTVRVSGDRLERNKWHEFLYGSQMAAALGVWPWTDVYKSSETPNILIATLSGGMVGLSDKMGDEDAANIFHAVRADGVIVKPDVPMTPIDASYVAEAKGENDAPLICATHTGEGSESAYYVFACTRKAKNAPPTPWKLNLSSLGITGAAVAYDFVDGSVQRLDATHPLTGRLSMLHDWSYTIIVPIGSSGRALVGDADLFVTRGPQRIVSSTDDGQSLHVKAIVAPGETSITLTAYVPALPHVNVTGGTLGTVVFDSSRKIATVQVKPDAVSATSSSIVEVGIN